MKLRISIFFLVVVCQLSCQQKMKNSTAQNSRNESIEKIIKSDEQWRTELNEIEYNVLREAGTERAFTGDLWDHKSDCIYTCAACDLPLFDSKTKFKSGSGWPSYYQPLKVDYIKEEKDVSFGMTRIEVLCARCGGHLGHVFNDGPQPTGLRYCINSASLNYIEKDSEK